MNVFITKYALSQGIIESEARLTSIANMIDAGKRGYFHKGEWFTTREEAEANAEHRRAKKIASLKKQIAKLEALSFTETA
jgi:hypothetical protein